MMTLPTMTGNSASSIGLLRHMSAQISTQSANFSAAARARLAYENFYHANHFKLIQQNIRANQKTLFNLETNPQYMGNWKAAINHAWDYERLDIQLGGKGSAHWSKAERAEILREGRLKRCEKWDSAIGHHISNKHDNPYAQSDANNIRFCRNIEEHKQLHNGDFRNKTDGEWIDRDAMVADTYRRGVVRKELLASASAFAIGFAVEATISLAIELSENGCDAESVGAALRSAGINGLKGGASGLMYYGGFKVAGMLTDKTVDFLGIPAKSSKFLKNGGGKIVIVGGLIIAADSVVKTKEDMANGKPFGEALKNAAQKEILPVSVLLVSLFHPYAGLIAGAASLGYDLWQGYHYKKILEQVEVHHLQCLCEHLQGRYQ